MAGNAELGEWLARRSWKLRAAFVLALDVGLWVAVLRGAFFYRHEESLLWFAFAPLALSVYVVYLVVKRPAAVKDPDWTRVVTPSDELPARSDPSGKPPLLAPLLVAQPNALPRDGAQVLDLALLNLGARVAGAALLIIAGLFHFGVWGVLGGLLFLVVILLLTATRRIDLDRDRITIVPLLPVRRSGSVFWSSLGPFESRRRNGITTLRAQSLDPPPWRSPLSRKGMFSLPASYGPGWFDPPLAASSLADLLERYRTSASSTRSPAIEPSVPVVAVQATASPRAQTITVQFRRRDGSTRAPQTIPLSLFDRSKPPAIGADIRYAGKLWRVDDASTPKTQGAHDAGPDLYLLTEVPE